LSLLGKKYNVTLIRNRMTLAEGEVPSSLTGGGKSAYPCDYQISVVSREGGKTQRLNEARQSSCSLYRKGDQSSGVRENLAIISTLKGDGKVACHYS